MGCLFDTTFFFMEVVSMREIWDAYDVIANNLVCGSCCILGIKFGWYAN